MMAAVGVISRAFQETFRIFRDTPVKIQFAAFILDLDTRQLTRGAREVRLSPKAFELLVMLVTERPKAVSKEALQQHLWPDTFVVEANLSNLVGEIREALDDRRRDPEFIRTLYGFGYAFVARTTLLTATDRRFDDQPRVWLEFATCRVALATGEHVIGRDADAAVRLDAASVSRRHAVVIVGAEGTMLEDCASKNGTYVDDERVTFPVALGDADEVRFGSVRATVRVASPFGTTQTHIQPRS
jgi:DNA-binding winged helix-turn-helix (wHTH) protein